jgi:hypothetical protein
MPKKQNPSGKMVSKADMVLHPTRFRIIMAVQGRQLTAQQIVAALPEESQASLYRHINRLCEAGILSVVDGVSPRGTAEKSYKVQEQAADLSESDTACVPYEDLLSYFTNFVAVLMSQGRTYLQKRALDGRSGGLWETEALYLSDEEFEYFLAALKGIQGLALSNLPGSGRRRRLLFTAIIPDE